MESIVIFGNGVEMTPEKLKLLSPRPVIDIYKILFSRANSYGDLDRWIQQLGKLRYISGKSQKELEEYMKFDLSLGAQKSSMAYLSYIYYNQNKKVAIEQIAESIKLGATQSQIQKGLKEGEKIHGK